MDKFVETTVEIYTDGACKGNPGPGGWGALLKLGAHEKTLCGGERETTNNRMELTAVIKALGELKRPVAARIYTDSRYVQQGISQWIVNWEKNGWRTADKKPVRNAELWRELRRLAAPHRIDWVWVKGHVGNPGNEQADRLAGQGLREYVF
ncbi:MAG: ribonuclease HI [Zoogloeaceae bacterium]|jgi:ribonuclease HI|nr:ribonuclease HI [Zoogloeaceae bacterium]